jgi:hypothetical protein
MWIHALSLLKIPKRQRRDAPEHGPEPPPVQSPSASDNRLPPLSAIPPMRLPTKYARQAFPESATGFVVSRKTGRPAAGADCVMYYV